MSVQEKLGDYGEFTVSLKANTHDAILDALKRYMYGTIYITPSEIDKDKIHPKEVARYAGIYRKREFTDTNRTITGASLWVLLGHREGHGSGVDKTPIDLTGESFEEALTAAIADTDIQVGNIVPEVGGLPAGVFFLQTARYKVEEICRQFAAEARITPKAQLDAGTPASLYPTYNDPIVFIKPGAKGVDPDWKLLPIASSAMGEDLVNVATEQLIVAEQEGVAIIQGEATASSSLRGPNGTLLEITDIAVDSQLGAAAADSRAAALLAKNNAPRKTVSLSTDDFDVDNSTVGVGDSIAVWNPDVGFADDTNKIQVRGEWFFPIILRVFGKSWPITAGMGVYLEPPTVSGDDNIFDLSPYFVPESGSTDLEVGAAERKLVPSPTESLGPVIAPVVNPDAPPPIPDPPTIFGNERSILVKQPTTSGGNPLPLTVTKFDVYASTTSGFTPGPTNYIGYISVAKADITLDIDVLKSFKWEEPAQTYVRTAAVNTAGPGPASTEVAVTAGLIPSAAILSLVAEKIEAGTVAVALLLTAAHLIGPLIETAPAPEQRVVLDGIDNDRIKFYTGILSESTPGYIASSAADGNLGIHSTQFSDGGGDEADIALIPAGGPSAFANSAIWLQAMEVQLGKFGSPSSLTVSDNISLVSTGDIDLSPTGSLFATAPFVTLTASTTLSGTAPDVALTATDDIVLTATDDIALTATGDINLGATTMNLDFNAGIIALNGSRIDLFHDDGGRVFIQTDVQMIVGGTTQGIFDDIPGGTSGDSGLRVNFTGIGMRRLIADPVTGNVSIVP